MSEHVTGWERGHTRDGTLRLSFECEGRSTMVHIRLTRQQATDLAVLLTDFGEVEA